MLQDRKNNLWIILIHITALLEEGFVHVFLFWLKRNWMNNKQVESQCSILNISILFCFFQRSLPIYSESLDSRMDVLSFSTHSQITRTYLECRGLFKTLDHPWYSEWRSSRNQICQLMYVSYRQGRLSRPVWCNIAGIGENHCWNMTFNIYKNLGVKNISRLYFSCDNSNL